MAFSKPLSDLSGLKMCKSIRILRSVHFIVVVLCLLYTWEGGQGKNKTVLDYLLSFLMISWTCHVRNISSNWLYLLHEFISNESIFLKRYMTDFCNVTLQDATTAVLQFHISPILLHAAHNFFLSWQTPWWMTEWIRAGPSLIYYVSPSG
jgi:hypothetical protein